METYYCMVTNLLAGILGLCVGSFLNVVICRLPQGMDLTAPSHCPACGCRLRWQDNIPLVSYLLLRGKCRQCKTRISWQYPAVELANGALWLLSVQLYWQESILLTCVYALAASVFLCIFCIDLRHKVIYDRFQILLLGLGIVSLFADPAHGWLSHLLGGAVGFGLFYLTAWGFEALCHKEGLGGGDIKLAGAAGLLLGWERFLLGLLVSTLPAAIILLAVQHTRQRKTGIKEDAYFPFGPFLVVGFGFSMFFGTQIVAWYLSLFGF